MIEYVSDSVRELLDALHGTTVTVDGREHTFDTEDADIVEREMSARQKLLKRLADPNVARHLEGKALAKAIYVPGRILNLVVR